MTRASGRRELLTRRDQHRGEEGAAAVLLLILTPVLFGLAGLVLDGGRQLSARQHGADLAEQGARSGADQLNTDAARDAASGGGNETAIDTAIDTSAATLAACHYVTSVQHDATCRATVIATPTGQRVHVEVTASSPTVLLGLVGINHLHVHSSADATAVTGIRTVLGQG